tara:strand:- start:988 stop:1488 length:501 start_codon:yes stop_codon:yes gene_type:complete
MALERIENLLSIKKGYYFILLLITLDLISKLIAEQYLEFGQSVPLIPILDFFLVYNSGIAFSILDINNKMLSFGLSILGLLIVGYLNALYRAQKSSIYQVTFILIISGAMGNILDRLVDGVVTDFLYLHIGNISFFVFNLADAYISIGAALFFIMEFKKYLYNSEP